MTKILYWLTIGLAVSICVVVGNIIYWGIVDPFLGKRIEDAEKQIRDRLQAKA